VTLSLQQAEASVTSGATVSGAAAEAPPSVSKSALRTSCEDVPVAVELRGGGPVIS
jgi:hypothetical protein